MPDLDIVPLHFSAVVVAAQRVGRVTRKLSPEVLFALPDGFRAAAVYEKEIDTVVCLDGSEVIGTFLARQLSQKNLFSLSSEKNICVVAPEHDSNGLLIFRDNLRPMVSEKNVLLLISTVNSGKTAARALECIEYYGGTTQGVAAVFSALKQVGDIPVISLFSPEDIPGYVTSLVKDCPMCKAGQKIDALSNSYGFSPLT